MDLNEINPRIDETPILKYSFDTIGQNNKLNAFHVRGSSSREIVNLNEHVLFFMQHGDSIWFGLKIFTKMINQICQSR